MPLLLYYNLQITDMINLNYHFEVVENQFDIGWEDITYVLQYLYLLLLYTVSPCTVHKSIQKICHTVQELFVQIADPFVKFRTIISFPHCARYSLLIGGIHKLCSHFLEIFDPPSPLRSHFYYIRVIV